MPQYRQGETPEQSCDWRTRTDRWFRWLIEGGVLGMVAASPWAFGSVEAEYEYLLGWCLAVLVGLWALRSVLAGELRLAKCPVTLGLAALFLLGVLQIVPLPAGMLSWLSPRTANLYGTLLPHRHETIAEQTEFPSTGKTVSVYPTATRRELLRILAAFLLFALVRHNLDGWRSLTRLGITATVNATLLAYLALAQSVSSAPDTIYWSIKTPGLVFGPFINRNHFAFYINICAGLGLGVLFWFYARDRFAGGWRERVGQLIGNSRALWMAGGLAVVFASSVLCLSRGGLFALAGSAVACLSLSLWTGRRQVRFETVAIPLAICVGLVVWLGWEPVRARLATIHGSAGEREGRWPLWHSTLQIAAHFPLWGTGYGTFQYVEPMYRRMPDDVLNEHAHNEYLESAADGGFVRLAIVLLLITLVLNHALRAYVQSDWRPNRGLMLGSLFGIVTVMLHSGVEFGLHIPAIVVLTTVLTALVCQVGSREGGWFVFRSGGLGGVLAGAIYLFLGLTVVVGSGTAAEAHRWQLAARRATSRNDLDQDSRCIEYLTGAVAAAPQFARLRLELAQAHLELRQLRRDQLEQATGPDDPSLAEQLAQLDRQHLQPALVHLLWARDLCPLLGEPHLQLAAHAASLRQADSTDAYLHRAKLLMPFDPTVWYFSGIHQFLETDRDQAWLDWRRCLELSDLFLPEILAAASAVLDDRQLIEHVIPVQPALLVQAAFERYPDPADESKRQPYFQAVLECEGTRAMTTPRDAWHAATAHRSLGQNAEALTAYQQAVAQNPQETEWRFGYAELLAEVGRADDARKELQSVLRRQPEHDAAKRLIEKLK